MILVSVCLPSDAVLQHLPSYVGFSYLGRGVYLHGYSSKAQPLLLTLDEVHLLTATTADLNMCSFFSPSCAHAATTPWTCGISPDYSLEGLMLKLQLQYCVHLMQRTVSLEKILILGRNEGQGEGDERG